MRASLQPYAQFPDCHGTQQPAPGQAFIPITLFFDSALGRLRQLWWALFTPATELKFTVSVPPYWDGGTVEGEGEAAGGLSTRRSLKHHDQRRHRHHDHQRHQHRLAAADAVEYKATSSGVFTVDFVSEDVVPAWTFPLGSCPAWPPCSSPDGGQCLGSDEGNGIGLETGTRWNETNADAITAAAAAPAIFPPPPHVTVPHPQCTCFAHAFGCGCERKNLGEFRSGTVSVRPFSAPYDAIRPQSRGRKLEQRDNETIAEEAEKERQHHRVGERLQLRTLGMPALSRYMVSQGTHVRFSPPFVSAPASVSVSVRQWGTDSKADGATLVVTATDLSNYGFTANLLRIDQVPSSPSPTVDHTAFSWDRPFLVDFIAWSLPSTPELCPGGQLHPCSVSIDSRDDVLPPPRYTHTPPCHPNIPLDPIGQGHGQCYNATTPFDNTSVFRCDCSPAWRGANCSDCAEGYYGPTCKVCAFNNVTGEVCSGHGNCSGSGTTAGDGSCTCEGNFGGRVCDTCISGTAGPRCDACEKRCSGHGQCIFNETQEPPYSNGDGRRSLLSFVGSLFGLEPKRSLLTSTHMGLFPALPDPGANGTLSCVCAEGWIGDDCNECADGFWGEDCTPCDPCEHGTCVGSGTRGGNGTCSCDVPELDLFLRLRAEADKEAEKLFQNGRRRSGPAVSAAPPKPPAIPKHGWGGPACDECLPGFFGGNCTPCPGMEYASIPKNRRMLRYGGGSRRVDDGVWYNGGGGTAVSIFVVCSGHGRCDDGLRGTGTCSCNQDAGRRRLSYLSLSSLARNPSRFGARVGSGSGSGDGSGGGGTGGGGGSIFDTGGTIYTGPDCSQLSFPLPPALLYVAVALLGAFCFGAFLWISNRWQQMRQLESRKAVADDLYRQLIAGEEEEDDDDDEDDLLLDDDDEDDNDFSIDDDSDEDIDDDLMDNEDDGCEFEEERRGEERSGEERNGAGAVLLVH